MPELVLIRGLPGSGKSTLARSMADTHCHVEADQFFEKDGKYIFIPEKIAEAHVWCQNRTKSLLDQGFDVVVSNTFTRKWEMDPYFNMGYMVRVIVAKGNYNSVHGVPPAAIERMRSRWEDV